MPALSKPSGMSKLMLVVALLGACVDEVGSDGTSEVIESLEGACGRNPVADEPHFQVVQGTYPGTYPHVCLPVAQYEARDAWQQKMSQWARCALVYARSQGGSQ